jgi:hypothetical protein
MPKQTLIAKKQRGPPPTGKGTPVMVRIQPDQLAALDEWIASAPHRIESRPDAIRKIVADYLRRRGFIKGTSTTAKVDPA